MNKYQSKNVNELKALLSSKGLKTTGTKAVLIQRLEEYDSKSGNNDDAATSNINSESANNLDNSNKIVKITLENIGQLTMEERIEARRRRFGTDTLKYKAEQRKNRFGINNSNDNKGVRRVIIQQ